MKPLRELGKNNYENFVKTIVDAVRKKEMEGKV